MEQILQVRGFWRCFSTWKLIITLFLSQKVGQNQRHKNMGPWNPRRLNLHVVSKCHGPSPININGLALTVEFDHCSLSWFQLPTVESDDSQAYAKAEVIILVVPLLWGRWALPRYEVQRYSWYNHAGSIKVLQKGLESWLRHALVSTTPPHSHPTKKNIAAPHARNYLSNSIESQHNLVGHYHDKVWELEVLTAILHETWQKGQVIGKEKNHPAIIFGGKPNVFFVCFGCCVPWIYLWECRPNEHTKLKYTVVPGKLLDCWPKISSNTYMGLNS